MSTVRLRRLQADYQKLVDYVRRHPRLRLIQTQGNPPELYQLEYQINSLRSTDDGLSVIKSHIVEIALPRNYPRTPPQCRMLTPIFHPNIAPHAICIGDHWAAGEALWAMAARIGEMIAYQSYNTKSPLNGEAARWVDNNLDRLPLDPVSMMVEEPDGQSEAEALPTLTPAPEAVRPRTSPSPFAAPPAAPLPTAATPSPPPTAAPPPPTAPPAAPLPTAAACEPAVIAFACPGCGATYRVPARNAGKQARCKQCQTVLRIPTPR